MSTPKLNPEIFREYDVRGVVDKDLTPETVAVLGRAYGTFLKGKGVTAAVVGRDPRPSSSTYASVMATALTECGIDVIDVGMVTTPAFYFSRVRYGIEGGVMVTGSHNPPEFNGLKLAYGHDTLFGDGIQELRRIAESGTFASGAGHYSTRDPLPDYVDDLLSKISLGPHKIRPVFDAGNGACGPIVHRVAKRLGLDYLCLYCEPDGRFPNHHPDPVQPKNLLDLVAVVKNGAYSPGIAFDGDADRIGVVDEYGTPVWGDELQIVFWKEILEKHPGALVLVEVKCSQALLDMVERLGGKPEFTRTGHSLIKAKMRETNALFSGEVSGHMFFADEYYGFDDALYAALRLLRIMSRTGKSVRELLSDVPKYYVTPETRVFCSDRDKFRVVEELTEIFAKDHPVITVDGVRVLFDDGWGLVRASNTQPALVLRCEGRSPEALARIKRQIEDELGRFPSVANVKWD